MTLFRAPAIRPIRRSSVSSSEILTGLNNKLDTIKTNRVIPSGDTEFKNVKLVGGYNWIDSKEPAIVVPGLPDVWSGNAGKIGQLKPDIEIPGYKEMTNQNGWRLLPEISSLEPIFHSLDSPDDLAGVQLVTDRNSLRKLYQLFTPDAINGQKPFRIDAQLVGDTVLFCRWESQSMVTPRAPHPFCFAKSHELATSEQQIEGINACHRIVRYQFGGITMMVRFELDAVTHIPAPASAASRPTKDDIVDLMSGVAVQTGMRPLPPVTDVSGGIAIHRSTYPSPPLSSFIEKKTRAMKGDLDYVDIYGQLVFSQTPNLYVARHVRGDFRTLEKIVLGEGKLKAVAQAADEVLGKVAGILRRMIELVKEHQAVRFVWDGVGTNVEVWEYSKQPQLSDKAKAMLLVGSAQL